MSEKSFIEKELGCDITVHGYRVLLKAIVFPESSKGGIIYTEQHKNLEKRGYNIGRVLKMGPLAYQPMDKFGGSPYCKPGDWVIYSSYERDEININDHLCFFVNDERIYATIADINQVVKGL
jgi:co-chaperonin GroES (HSP10)